MRKHQETGLSKTKGETAQLTQAETHVRMEPPVDIYENDLEILIISDMPGINTPDLEVRLDTPELFIQGRQPVPPTEQQAQIKPLFFERTFRVPPSIDPDGVKAELKNGVLKIHLAKSEKARPKKIAVHTV